MLLCDDSGSMQRQCLDGTGKSALDPYGKLPTRWSELCKYVTIAVELATCFDDDGVDVRFLNRAGKMGVKSAQEVQGLFVEPPKGYTPITSALQKIIQDYSRSLSERKLLVVLATDGEPTTTTGYIDKVSFYNVVRGMPTGMYLSILACTDDYDSVAYLDDIDTTLPRVDVCDDYPSELQQIHKVQGKSFSFSFGSYVVKTLLGSVDSYFDNLDEPQRNVTTTMKRQKKKNKEKCIVM